MSAQLSEKWTEGSASYSGSYTASEWINTMSGLLQARWPSIDPARLDDVASDLWLDEGLRALPPQTAAERWLEPVHYLRR